MTNYSIEECLTKIAHYEVASRREMMKGRWYELCQLSIADWQVKLERERAA
jgi:hypothetical protein